MPDTMIPHVVQADTLSLGWALAFSRVHEAAGGELRPLLLRLTGADASPPTGDAVREVLDQALQQVGRRDTQTVANTIFPDRLWDPAQPRERLYERFERIHPVVRQCRANRKGTYFQRMIGFEWEGSRSVPGAVNQLEEVIKSLSRRGAIRREHQVCVFDPTRDLPIRREPAFPCLQQLAFQPIGKDRLAMSAFYATQYMFERAYGNYLGLWRLGQFVAQETTRQMWELDCFVGVAMLGHPKAELAGLAARIRGIVNDTAQTAAAAPLPL